MKSLPSQTPLKNKLFTTIAGNNNRQYEASIFPQAVC